jgi:hypothetical protein
MAYIGKQPVVGNFVKLDAITTSATATYNLLNGGVAYFPQTANNCIVSLNGVIQSPTSAYTISGSTIVFSDALTASDSIDFILVLGDVLSIGTPSDATVTNAKLALTAGSAGTPTISTAADTNTGIFFPAADEIALTEGGVEGVRLNSSGNVQFAKNISIGGATPTTSGTGITFPGTASRSTNGNTLDDFEEGTFTATLTGSTAAPTIPVTTTGTYVKISGLVFIKLYFAGVTTTGATGNLNITGMPFTAEGLQILPILCYGQDFTDSPAVMSIQVYIENSTTLALLVTTDNAAWDAPNITSGSSKFYAVTGTYYTTS